ncbi:MAG: MFS transporter [Thermogutta sp.]
MLSEKLLLRIRLSAMMFLQFFVWACWMVPVGTYGPEALGLKGAQMGWIFSTTAIAAIVSPLFVGYVADRLFATERVLFALHLIGGICLILAGLQGTFLPLFIFLMASTLAFMPTLALANSLTFRNLDDPATFPRIAMFGTIGWIISGWIVGFTLGERSPAFFFLGGIVEILLGIYALTLPHTPPQAKEGGVGDVLGLGAIKLLKDPEFLIFTVCAFLIGIPAVYYFVSCNLYLTQIGAPAPTALMTLGQLCEIAVMATMPIFIARIGLNRILAIGMLVWALRYLLFASLSYPLALLAILVHGFCYVFVYVGSYIFVDTKAPRELRASAQSFIAFLMLGVAWLIGSNLAGRTNDAYPPSIREMVSAMVSSSEVPADFSPPAWSDLAKELDRNGDNVIEWAETQKVNPKDKTTNNWVTMLTKATPLVSPRTYGHIRAAAAGERIYLNREDYLALTRYKWRDIWLWPAIISLVVFAVFTLGMPKKAEAEAAKESPEAESPAEASLRGEASGPQPGETQPQPGESGVPGETPPDIPFNSP